MNNLRPVRQITAKEANIRLGALANESFNVFKQDPVEPEPVNTYVVACFQITGYDQDCDGSLMAKLKQVDRNGEETGWFQTYLGLYSETELVVSHPSILWDTDDEEEPTEPPAESPASGAWIVYSYDSGPYPIALYEHEIDALRHVVRLGYGSVKFWEFGTEWTES